MKESRQEEPSMKIERRIIMRRNCENCEYFHIVYDIEGGQEIEASWCDIWGMLDVTEREQCKDFVEV